MERMRAHLTALGGDILQLGGQLLVLAQGLAELIRERRLPRLLRARLLCRCLRLPRSLLSRLSLPHRLVSVPCRCHLVFGADSANTTGYSGQPTNYVHAAYSSPYRSLQPLTAGNASLKSNCSRS